MASFEPIDLSDVARLHLEIQIFELVLPFEVHVIEDIGNPADATLADHHSDPGMMFEYAGENDRHQRYRHIHLKARDGGGEGGAANFVFQLPQVRERATDRM